MSTLVAILVPLLVFLGVSEVAVAAKKGLPGRRVGAGTRYYSLSKPSIHID